MDRKTSTITTNTGKVQSPIVDKRKSSNTTIQDNNFDQSDEDEDGSFEQNNSYDPYLPRKDQNVINSSNANAGAVFAHYRTDSFQLRGDGGVDHGGLVTPMANNSNNTDQLFNRDLRHTRKLNENLKLDNTYDLDNLT